MTDRDLLRGLPVFDRPLPAFDPESAPGDPSALFLAWLHAAIDAGVSEPHAMTLSTVDAEGRPDARVLILKDVDRRRLAVRDRHHQRQGQPTRRQPARGAQLPLARTGPAGPRPRPGGARRPERQRRRLPGQAGRVADRGAGGPAERRARGPAQARPRDRGGHPAPGRQSAAVAEDHAVYVLTPAEVEFWQGDQPAAARSGCGTADPLTAGSPNGSGPNLTIMVTRMADGSAGDADYATIGDAYTRYRRPDPRIAAQIAEALGPARTVLNVGAGAGSYEPADREVTPVEPSASMRAQRPGRPGGRRGRDRREPAVRRRLLRRRDDDLQRAPVGRPAGRAARDAAGHPRPGRDPDLRPGPGAGVLAVRVRARGPGHRGPPLPGHRGDSPTGSAAPSPSTGSRSRSTARTGSTRRTTAGRRPCSTRPRGCPARPGASSVPRCTTASPGN